MKGYLDNFEKKKIFVGLIRVEIVDIVWIVFRFVMDNNLLYIFWNIYI